MISSEFRKSKRIHDDMFMEMYITQNIMKECDTKFHKVPGYIQNFQVDPFSVHGNRTKHSYATPKEEDSTDPVD